MAEPPPEFVMHMGEYRRHLRELDRLDALAFDAARRLGSGAVGPPHLVLAMLDPEVGDSVAGKALRDVGITQQAVEELTRSYAGDGDAVETPQHNPAALHMQCRAEGLAAGLGDPDVRAEHLLLAYLWDPNDSEHALIKLGASREHVRDRLAQLGVGVPGELPAADPRRYGPDVYVSLDELGVLIEELWYVLPQGASFAFNHDGEKGWVAVTEGLEPKGYIDAALERHRRAYPQQHPDRSMT
jgi:hypothetical protein